MTRDSPAADKQGFWGSYYRGVFEERRSWLDYSNDRVQAQTFGLTLDAAGPISGKRCIDVGCGWGQLARALHGLGAVEVTAIDLVPEPIAELARDFPQIRWLQGDISTGELDLPRESADVLLLIEVLQYMPFVPTLVAAWNLVAPGGRMVAVVPNADCPIVTRTRQRFDQRYGPPTIDDVRRGLATLPGVHSWSYRGLEFAEDQQIAPYKLTAWTQTATWSPPPNRIQFAALK
jgi:trans-aconitate methyltransferase